MKPSRLVTSGGVRRHTVRASVVSVAATFDNTLDEGDEIDGCLAGIEERKPRWA